MGYQTEPGEITERDAITQLRVIDTVSGEVVQIALIDTGATTPDSTPIYSMGTVSTIPGSITSNDKLTPMEGALDVAVAGTAQSLNEFPIIAADHTTQEIGVRGDWTDKITAGDSLTIAGSTANDGTHVVVSSSYAAGTTTIIFAAGSIIDSTVDGVLSFAAGKFMIASIIIQGKTANTNNVYIGGKGIAAGLGIGITAEELATVDGSGYPLDLADLYIDVDTNGEGITWTLLG